MHKMVIGFARLRLALEPSSDAKIPPHSYKSQLRDHGLHY